MISFDLRCGAGHVFEAWFATGAAYEKQAAAGQVACPFCGSSEVAKAVMAPNIAAKGNRTSGKNPADLVRALAAAQAKALRSSDWVGDAFAGRARAMHAGTEPNAPIHGRVTTDEAQSLMDDGVPVAPLPFPVVPPEELN